MAEEQDNTSKTEQPTPRKLEQARAKGDVAKTPDLAAVMTLAAAFGVILLAGGWMSRTLASAMLPFVAHPDQIQLDGHGGVSVFRHAIEALAPSLGVVMLAT